eukprot:9888512-Alexandrium_andersonii.AAC.1
MGNPLPPPLALYTAGVRYSSQIAGRAKSVTGFWLINLHSGSRHLLATLSSNELCKCGCRGWCSVFALLAAVAWQLKAAACGQRPSQCVDGSPIPEG